jgi:hypothetical protein
VSSLLPKRYYSSKRDAVKCVKKPLRENDVVAVLQRLDRLTQDVAPTTAAQTLEVIYGLVQNMSRVMDGEQISWLVILIY